MIAPQALAQEVACYLGIELSGIKIKRFADGEIYVQILVHPCSMPPSPIPVRPLPSSPAHGLGGRKRQRRCVRVHQVQHAPLVPASGRLGLGGCALPGWPYAFCR